MRAVFAAAAVAVMAASALPVNARDLPEIRTSEANQVPACVTPERLMAFLTERNGSLQPRFRSIASWYEYWGKSWDVRWDFAFFQMVHETNYLTFLRGNGRPGDVHPDQNNFAGLGAVGGGVPGDSFPDVRTGVLAQIQHLIAYSGEYLAEPVAPRTRLKQDVIVSVSRKKGRSIRFSDLTKRWAADPRYHVALANTADRFMTRHCSPRADAGDADGASGLLAGEVVARAGALPGGNAEPGAAPGARDPGTRDELSRLAAFSRTGLPILSERRD